MNIYPSQKLSGPQIKNTVCAFLITYKLLCLYLGRFLKKLADDQCSSKPKGSIYHIVKQKSMKPLTMGVD